MVALRYRIVTMYQRELRKWWECLLAVKNELSPVGMTHYR